MVIWKAEKSSSLFPSIGWLVFWSIHVSNYSSSYFRICRNCWLGSGSWLMTTLRIVVLNQDHTYQDHFCSMCPRSFELHSSITTKPWWWVLTHFLSGKHLVSSGTNWWLFSLQFCRVMEVDQAEWSTLKEYQIDTDI